MSASEKAQQNTQIGRYSTQLRWNLHPQRGKLLVGSRVSVTMG